MTLLDINKKVLALVEELNPNGELLGNINSETYNTYMDNSELPTYFMLSGNDTYKVSIKSVKVVQN